MTTPRQHIVCTSCGSVNRVPEGATLTQGKCGTCRAPLASAKPVEIDDKLLARLLARDEDLFVLDVWAPWCGPCRMMAPAYAETASGFAGRLRFFKLDSEAYPQAATRLQVRGIPALFIVRGGKLIAQHSGAMTEAVLRRWLSAETELAPVISD